MGNTSSLDIGAKIATRKKDPKTKEPRTGMIVRKVYEDGGSGVPGTKKKFKWEVQFRSGEKELLSSSQIKREARADDNKSITWTVVQEHNPETELEEYDQVGLAGYNFERLSEDLDYNSDDYDHPFASLFEHLYPGNRNSQRANMNKEVNRQNELKSTKIKEFTEREFMQGLGIFIYAGAAEFGGADKLWAQPKKQNLPKVIVRQLVTCMSKARFNDFKKFLPSAFEGTDQDDAWNNIMGLVDGFNKNRQRNVAASFYKVLDESMCSFKPRSTQFGGLPHISSIMRKPRGIGTEFKTVCDSATGK